VVRGYSPYNTWAYIIQDTVHLERYMNNILEPFFQILTNEEKQHQYFQ
jgi:hypothetical protein